MDYQLSFIMIILSITFSLFGIEGGAALAGRENMIPALSKLKQWQNSPQLPKEMSAFAISLGKMSALFSSHPPLSKRIASLRIQ